jgi:outer membrane protein OmpA-like peptidoglycan-associated protein
MLRQSCPWIATALALASGAVATSFAGDANAQQKTFHLDRLEVPGAPDDGLALFRPVVQKTPMIYAQLGLGYALNPLRMSTLIPRDGPVLQNSPAHAITGQFSTYMSGGVELFDRLILGATFPIAWIETGEQPNIQANMFAAGTAYTNYSTTGPAVGDMRLDARYLAWRSDEGDKALAAHAGLWMPTGAGSSTNFGGDGSNVGVLLMGDYEWTPSHFATLVANLGVAIRPEHSVNDPAGHAGPRNGLGVGSELRWALGALLPLQGGKFRVGATIFGQTGLVDSDTTGPTFLRLQNTPIEWNLEGRMQVPQIGWEHFYVGAAAGSLIVNGYGAPDLRVVLLAGSYFPFPEAKAGSPNARLRARPRIVESMKDTDGDGIPDDIDACPDVPEDHKDPDPSDGCPAPADRDGDGIPDQYDKCPDQPEDLDGIDDQDGCPEDDADSDGVPDAKDACPKEPGQPDPDPTKNGCPRFIKLEGSTVRVLQQVHFETGSATILPDSFAMLQEIVDLLKVNPTIRKMRVEGHTDNRGNAAMNLDLSTRRAASVRAWLSAHGTEQERLESEGYGLTRPIQTNDTDEGRAANRRVEFKIVDEDTGGPPGAKKPGEPSAPSQPPAPTEPPAPAEPPAPPPEPIDLDK